MPSATELLRPLANCSLKKEILCIKDEYFYGIIIFVTIVLLAIVIFGIISPETRADVPWLAWGIAGVVPVVAGLFVRYVYGCTRYQLDKERRDRHLSLVKPAAF